MATMTPQVLQGVESCPRCSRANPAFRILGSWQPLSMSEFGLDGYFRICGLYQCTTCGNVIVAETGIVSSSHPGSRVDVFQLLPAAQTIDSKITGKPRQFLSDALNSMNAPTASIMASCSAIDAMLKERGIGRIGPDGKARNLYRRIDDAVSAGVLTKDMALWAHKVRLDANDQRHADDDAAIPTQSQAQSIFDLAKGLAEFLIVLPARVSDVASVE